MNLFNVLGNRQKVKEQDHVLRESLEKIFTDYGIGNDTVILDLGCADLRDYSDFLILKSEKYFGIDISGKDIKLAGEKLRSKTHCELIQSSIEEYDIRENFFDVVVCNNMLAYTDQQISINKIYKALKVNGICISFNNNTWQYSVYKILYPFKPFPKEVIHSILVIMNSCLFYLIGIKIFHTIFNRRKYLKRIIKKYNPATLTIEYDVNSLPYSVINFVFVK